MGTSVQDRPPKPVLSSALPQCNIVTLSPSSSQASSQKRGQKAGKSQVWARWNCFESHSLHCDVEIASDYILKLFSPDPHPSEVNEMFASDLNGLWNRPAMLLVPSNTSFTCRMKVLLPSQWASLLLPPLSVSMGP